MNSIHFYKMCLKKLNFLVLGRQLTSIPDPLTESQKSLLPQSLADPCCCCGVTGYKHTHTHTATDSGR